MGKKSDVTQARIAETAREMFLEKGFDGVKMQELANRAGVNKGLLHHYFNNKQGLFDMVFKNAVDQFFGEIEAILAQTDSLEIKVSAIVDTYLDMLLANPNLPLFVFFELNKDQKNVDIPINAERISILVKGFKKDNIDITEQKAFHMILTIVSLSVFPFMAKPIIMQVVKNDSNFIKLIEERRPIIKSLLKNLVKTL